MNRFRLAVILGVISFLVGGFVLLTSLFPTVTAITKSSPDRKHVAKLTRVYGFDAVIKVAADGRQVYFSPDFAPTSADFREQILWDKTSRFFVLEVAGRRLFGYHVVERRPLAESELTQLELTPFEELGFEGQTPLASVIDENLTPKNDGIIWEKQAVTNSEQDVLPFRLLPPLNYDKSKTYPLILFLHGGGAEGTDNEKQLAAGVPLLVTKERREKYPCFIAAPQYPGEPPLEHWGQVVVRGLLLDMIRFVEKEYPIDSKRIYVTGISNGGVGTFAALTRHPKTFAAAVPVCGGGAPDLAEKFATVPIWIFHGAKDDVIPVGKSREMVTALRKAGGKPKYTEFPDAGHDIVERTYNSDELFEWLFAQKRE